MRHLKEARRRSRCPSSSPWADWQHSHICVRVMVGTVRLRFSEAAGIHRAASQRERTLLRASSSHRDVCTIVQQTTLVLKLQTQNWHRPQVDGSSPGKQMGRSSDTGSRVRNFRRHFDLTLNLRQAKPRAKTHGSPSPKKLGNYLKTPWASSDVRIDAPICPPPEKAKMTGHPS